MATTAGNDGEQDTVILLDSPLAIQVVQASTARHIAKASSSSMAIVVVTKPIPISGEEEDSDVETAL